jgi:hypothetical protein
MMRCDPARTSVLLTEIRSSAESIRAYGGLGAGRGLVGTTPLALHLTAAHIESQMRAWAHVDEAIAASFAVSATNPGPTPRLVEFPGLRIVPTLVAPQALSTEVRVAELRATAARLSTVADTFTGALDTSASPHYIKLVAKEASTIRAFIDAIA